MSPRGPSRVSKTQKPAFAKTMKNHWFFKVFGVQRPPKRSSGGPRRLPRGTQRAPKLPKRGSKIGPQILPIVGPILGRFWGPFWDPKLLQKGTKNGSKNGTLSHRISGVRKVARQELNESGEKGIGAGNIFNKRRGGILRTLRALLRTQCLIGFIRLNKL